MSIFRGGLAGLAAASLFLSACQKPQAVSLPVVTLPAGAPFSIVQPPPPKVTPSDKKGSAYIGVLSGITPVAGGLVVIGYQGTLLRLSSKTGQWSRIKPPVHADFYGITRTPSGDLWVAGDQGTLLRSRDEGGSWQSVQTGIGHLFLNAVSFPSERVGYAVGEGGVILKTTDGGSHWSRISSPTKKNLYAVAFWSEEDGVVAGWHKRLFRTGDGGSRFTAIDIPMQKVTRQKPSFNSLWAGQREILLAGDHGLLFSSTDEGKTFSQIQTGSLHDLYGVCRTGQGTLAAAGEQGTLLLITGGPPGQRKISAPLGSFRGSDFLGITCGTAHVRLVGSKEVVLLPSAMK